jgi:SAM-dependent methyltransferase
VLDVGVGGGRSCLPLAPPATALVGVDEQAAMLEQFAEACRTAGTPSEGNLGRWPDVAAHVPHVDVVVCHHVVYNVADIEPFLTALTDHARRLVVVELPERHPTSWMNPLWERFWSLPRPTEPSAELFTEIVRSLGWLPEVAWAERTPRAMVGGHTPEFVAFARQRLCLPAERDAEVAVALAELPATGVHRVATVSWRPRS